MAWVTIAVECGGEVGITSPTALIGLAAIAVECGGAAGFACFRAQ